MIDKSTKLIFLILKKLRKVDIFSKLMVLKVSLQLPPTAQIPKNLLQAISSLHYSGMVESWVYYFL